MSIYLLTLACFFAAAAAFPYLVIALAGAWPWLLARRARGTSPNLLLHGIVLTAGTAAGIHLRRNLLAIDDAALGGGVVWFVAITLGILAFGLSAIIFGIRRQDERERRRQARG